MKNLVKGRKGITLIALVITILVILILAGVTIATLTGDNGLLQKATSAKKANEEASALEKIKVEVAGSYGLDGKINIEELNNNLIKISGLKKEGETLSNLNKIDKLPEIVELDQNSFVIKKDGTVTPIKPCSIGDLNSDNYGDYLDLGKNIVGNEVTTDDWRIIYNDTQNKKVYATLCEYLPDSIRVPEQLGLTQKSNGNRVVQGSADVMEVAFQSVLWKQELLPDNLQDNIKITVEGGVTPEVLVKSYNEKHKTTLTYESKPVLYLDPEDESKGMDTLYAQHYKHWENTNTPYCGAYGQWLYKKISQTGMWALGLGGEVHDNTCSVGAAPFGLVPVTIIDSDVKIIKKESEVKVVWELIN